MKKYKSTAPCGFCRFFGRISEGVENDICWDCEVRKIREHLELLTDKALWECPFSRKKVGKEAEICEINEI